MDNQPAVSRPLDRMDSDAARQLPGRGALRRSRQLGKRPRKKAVWRITHGQASGDSERGAGGNRIAAAAAARALHTPRGGVSIGRQPTKRAISRSSLVRAVGRGAACAKNELDRDGVEASRSRGVGTKPQSPSASSERPFVRSPTRQRPTSRPGCATSIRGLRASSIIESCTMRSAGACARGPVACGISLAADGRPSGALTARRQEPRRSRHAPRVGRSAGGGGAERRGDSGRTAVANAQ